MDHVERRRQDFNKVGLAGSGVHVLTAKGEVFDLVSGLSDDPGARQTRDVRECDLEGTAETVVVGDVLGTSSGLGIVGLKEVLALFDQTRSSVESLKRLGHASLKGWTDLLHVLEHLIPAPARVRVVEKRRPGVVLSGLSSRVVRSVDGR